MTIEREEIFGPVLSVISYQDEDDAVRIANDTVYRLAAYVQSKDIAHARKVAARIRAGQVSINYPDRTPWRPSAATSSRATARRIRRLGDPGFLEIKGHRRLRRHRRLYWRSSPAPR